jgi:hypothetical protein
MQKIGGQAVIEGVMMKSPRAWTVAVRDSKGNIHLKREALHELPKALRMPVLRGVVTLYHALSIGIRALEFSASKAYEEESDKPMSKASMALSVGTAVVLAVVLFILLPLYAAKLLGVVIPRVEESSVLFNLADGVVRVFIFILYIVLVGLWGEMRAGTCEREGLQPSSSEMRDEFPDDRDDCKHHGVLPHPPGLALPVQVSGTGGADTPHCRGLLRGSEALGQAE